jgi:two-component system NtrC family response regulator
VIERLGGRREIDIDVRIVCATHQDLEAMIAEGRFREDLWYRLAELVLKVPPLVERSGDTLLLARHFLRRFAKEMRRPARGFTPEAIAVISSWTWPGNVRELENRVKRAVVMAEGKLVGPQDLDLEGDGEGGPINLRAVREVADRKAIRHAIARTDGNISSAAKLLGISRPTLYDLMKQYDFHG